MEFNTIEILSTRTSPTEESIAVLEDKANPGKFYISAYGMLLNEKPLTNLASVKSILKEVAEADNAENLETKVDTLLSAGNVAGAFELCEVTNNLMAERLKMHAALATKYGTINSRVAIYTKAQQSMEQFTELYTKVMGKIDAKELEITKNRVQAEIQNEIRTQVDSFVGDLKNKQTDRDAFVTTFKLTGYKDNGEPTLNDADYKNNTKVEEYKKARVQYAAFKKLEGVEKEVAQDFENAVSAEDTEPKNKPTDVSPWLADYPSLEQFKADNNLPNEDYKKHLQEPQKPDLKVYDAKKVADYISELKKYKAAMVIKAFYELQQKEIERFKKMGNIFNRGKRQEKEINQEKKNVDVPEIDAYAKFYDEAEKFAKKYGLECKSIEKNYKIIKDDGLSVEEKKVKIVDVAYLVAQRNKDLTPLQRAALEALIEQAKNHIEKMEKLNEKAMEREAEPGRV
ncbi:MAG: hypothetical protein IJ538_00695 [Clostridia bacterium]|nr:hypothetical protein [Clostridia bacterium]